MWWKLSDPCRLLLWKYQWLYYDFYCEGFFISQCWIESSCAPQMFLQRPEDEEVLMKFWWSSETGRKLGTVSFNLVAGRLLLCSCSTTWRTAVELQPLWFSVLMFFYFQHQQVCVSSPPLFGSIKTCLLCCKLMPGCFWSHLESIWTEPWVGITAGFASFCSFSFSVSIGGVAQHYSVM